MYVTPVISGRPGVDLAQAQDGFQCVGRLLNHWPSDQACRNRLQVALGQVVGLQLKPRIAWWSCAQRIQLSFEIAVVPNGLGQSHDADKFPWLARFEGTGLTL